MQAATGEYGSQKTAKSDFADVRTVLELARGDSRLPGGIGFDAPMQSRGEVVNGRLRTCVEFHE